MVDADFARKMLESIILDTDYFLANADRDLVLEFPFAASNKMPEQIVGYDAAEKYLRGVGDLLPGLAFSNIRVMPLREEGAFLLEYDGTCPPVGNYDQSYITIMRFREGKIALFREYWDTAEVNRALDIK